MTTGGYTSNAGYGPEKAPEPESEPNLRYPFALVGLIGGVVAIFWNPFLAPSVVALVFGGIGLRHSFLKRTPSGQKPGFGVSIAALVLGAAGAILSIVVLVIFWQSTPAPI
jgi:hypothetical protein